MREDFDQEKFFLAENLSEIVDTITDMEVELIQEVELQHGPEVMFSPC